jgi:CBS-domain-containing membrane protein
MRFQPDHLMTGQTLEHAARRMRDKEIRFLPVCRPDSRLVGVVTERDIVIRGVARSRAAELCPVDEVMSLDFPTCSPETVLDLESSDGEAGLSPLVVVDALGHLLGTILQETQRGGSASLGRRGRLLSLPVSGPLAPRRRASKAGA